MSSDLAFQGIPRPLNIDLVNFSWFAVLNSIHLGINKETYIFNHCLECYGCGQNGTVINRPTKLRLCQRCNQIYYIHKRKYLTREEEYRALADGRRLKDKRECYSCGVTSCYTVKGIANWINNYDVETKEIIHIVCFKCYDRMLYRTRVFPNYDDFRASQRENLRKRRHLIHTPPKDSSIEVKIQQGLTNLGIKYEKHKHLMGTPDIFIEPNLCIFADGEYWHSRPRDIIHDKDVNNWLKTHGYAILRFSGRKIKKNIDRVISTILSNMSDAYSKNT